jgi:hypothetical protein
VTCGILLLMTAAPGLIAQNGKIKDRNVSLIVRSRGHTSMNITYQFGADGTFQYVLSSSDVLVLCKGKCKIAENHLTLQNTEARVLKGRPAGQAFDDEPETVRLAIENSDTLVLTYEDTSCSDTYKRMKKE